MASRRGFKPPVKRQFVPVQVKDGGRAAKPLSNSQYEEIFDAVVHFEGIRSPGQAESLKTLATEPQESASVDNSQSSLVHATRTAALNPEHRAVDSETQCVGDSASSVAFKVPVKQPPDSESSASHASSAKVKVHRVNTLREALKVQESNSQFSNSLSQLGTSSSLLTQEAVLSQPPKHLRHRERLQWLQDRRGVGLYILCGNCKKWRWSDIDDPVDVPKTWSCRLNPDVNYNACVIPEKPIGVYVEEDLIHNEYTAGSIVWAKLYGYPWWPAMVDDCPDTEQYYWLDGYSDIPTHYHVVFFDYESNEISRSWIVRRDLVSFKHEPNLDKQYSMKTGHKCRIDSGKLQAEQALKLRVKERLKRYSFLARWTKEIITPPGSDSELLEQAASATGRRKVKKQRKERAKKSVESLDDGLGAEKAKQRGKKPKDKKEGSSAEEEKASEDTSRRGTLTRNDKESAGGEQQDKEAKEEIGDAEISVRKVRKGSKQGSNCGRRVKSVPMKSGKRTASRKKCQVLEGAQSEPKALQDEEMESEPDKQAEASQDEQSGASQDDQSEPGAQGEQGKALQDEEIESEPDKQAEASQDEHSEPSQADQAKAPQDEEPESPQSEHKTKRSNTPGQNGKTAKDSKPKRKESSNDHKTGASHGNLQPKHCAKPNETSAKSGNKRKETGPAKDEKDKKQYRVKLVPKHSLNSARTSSRRNEKEESDNNSDRDEVTARSSGDKHLQHKQKDLNSTSSKTETKNGSAKHGRKAKESNAKAKALASSKLSAKPSQTLQDGHSRKSKLTTGKPHQLDEDSDTLDTDATETKANTDVDESPAPGAPSPTSVSEQSFEQIAHQVAHIVGEPIAEEISDQIHTEWNDETPDLLVSTAVAEPGTNEEDTSVNSEPEALFSQSSSMESLALNAQLLFLEESSTNPAELNSELKEYISQTLGDHVDIFENSGQSIGAEEESDEDLKRLREHITNSRINEQDPRAVLTTNIAFEKLANANEGAQQQKKTLRSGKQKRRVDQDSDCSELEVRSVKKKKSRKLVHYDEPETDGRDLGDEVEVREGKETRPKTTGKENEKTKIGKKLNKADFVLKRTLSQDRTEKARKIAKTDDNTVKSDSKTDKSSTEMDKHGAAIGEDSTKGATSNTKRDNSDRKPAEKDNQAKSDKLAKNNTERAKKDTKRAKNYTKRASSGAKRARSDSSRAKEDSPANGDSKIAKGDTKSASVDFNQPCTSGLSKIGKKPKKIKAFQPPLRKSSNSEASTSEESKNSEPQCQPLDLQVHQEDVDNTLSQSPVTSSVAVVPNSEDRLLDVLKRLSPDSLPFDFD